MTDLLIESLRGLSSAAAEALESLEANDYRKEVRKLKDSNLPLRMMQGPYRTLWTASSDTARQQ